ncbi:MAG: T9SS type A sorting domain-containing protein [Gloeobacteraceae cyanobacterium ES-bin-316]|nr:T9SS type A sorting domain-containing protein [Ferruginibacter sp.]
MKPFLSFPAKLLPIILLFFFGLLHAEYSIGQQATVSVPVGIGRPCGAGSANDSVKYFNYNSTSNLLTHRSICRPSLAFPGFSSSLASITFSPFDGYLYFSQIRLVGSVYNTYTFRWLPTVCPNLLPLPVYRTFNNQFVAGVEFDPATGLAYQISFIDTSGAAPVQIATTGNTGQYTSGAVVNGLPAASFYDQSNGDLMYVRALDATGLEWNASIIVSGVGNVGQYTSLKIVNGNPAITYYDISNGDLKFVRATNADGTAWGAPVTVDAAGTTGLYTSIEIVNGNPAIAYYDLTNLDLRFVRASDVNGTAWAAPVTLDATGSVGEYTSMKIVNGNPAVSYFDATGLDLKYIRSTDVSGAVWGAPVILDATGSTGQYTSLEIVNGNPAVSYHDVTNQDLKFIRASDASGGTWPAALTVFATGNTGQYTSLKVVNGTAAIAYFDASTQDLKYIRAIDANGATWGAQTTPEAAANVGQFGSLLIVNGNPSIFYYDISAQDAKFIRSKNVNGSSWYFNSNVFNMELQEVNFVTGVLGPLKAVNFGSRYIYRQSGDVVMTPGGQMLAIFNNKYFTINWRDYASALPLVATYIDTVNLGTNNLIGLAYSGGKLLGSSRNNSGGNCIYSEIDILTGAVSPVINGAATVFSSADMTNVPSGIGAAKRLVSATENPVGSQTYDIVYEVILRNYGGTPVSNVQAFDTLNNINGFANLISGSITSFTAPAGITANPLYDGKNAGRFSLLTPGSSFSNIPGQNEITLQITCRVSNILPGIIYNNQLAVSATGLLGDALRDLSTDGSIPDLNSNDKPDDLGEGQPTPLLISVAAQTPPCTVLSKVLFSQDFGAGTGLTASPPPAVAGTGVTGITQTTSYSGSVAQPIPVETYTITNNANNANNAEFINLTDNTGNPNGRMFIVNADADNRRMYRGGFTFPLCPQQQYSVSFYAAFLGNAAYQTKCAAFGGFRYPRILIRIRDGATGLIITEIATPDITATTWQQYGVKFVSPASYSSIFFELINDALGGCGNDIALDDIRFGSCDPIPLVGVNSLAGCVGSQSSFIGSLTDPAAVPGAKDYQWQVSNALAGPYVDIAGATSSTYSINPVLPSDTGRYYRLLVSAAGNITNVNCRFISPSTLLSGRMPSVEPTSANKNKDNICAGLQVNLSLSGGSLGTNANWRWYEGSCASTLVGSGPTLSVLPSVTTSYFVRAEGDCNVTACQPVDISITCDIDKDNDGIPDYVESYMSAALLDHNSNGVTNAFDLLYPGYIDNNNDHINDNFQADGDSDNDGILNYLDATFAGRVDTNGDTVDDRFDMDLDGIINMRDMDSDNDGITDVVEATGADVNGDGVIDVYTDTDDDGLSQNVDGNNTGARISGIGLGVIDLDLDGRPNTIDLDSDGDGIPDVVEAAGPDANNNARIDGFVDANNDGLIDTYINASALLRTGADVTSDGRADSYPFKNFDNDRRANPYDIDSDMDGIVDVIEAAFADADNNGFIDGPISGDGWNTALRSLPSLNLRNADGDANFDYLDIDNDADGIPDNVEGQTTLGYRFPAYLDNDNDGLDNSYDLAPFTATFGGAGILPADRDGDFIPDYLDLDTDSDGVPDIVEGNDYNLNGLSDDLVTPTGIDTDGDGLDNRFDSLNSVTNIRGTSYMMGTGGSLVGDPAPGTRAPVQKFNIAQPERDWRYVTYVLPLQYLQLNAAESKNSVSLNWGVMSTSPLKTFEIERSTDNINFEKISSQSADVPLEQLRNFTAYDNINLVNSDVIFYRIKVIAKNDQEKYSNVVVIRKTSTKQPITLQPNPANNVASLRFYADKETQVTISIKDVTGRVVHTQKATAFKGNNSVQLSGLAKYSNGVYNVHILINNDVFALKLIIQN